MSCPRTWGGFERLSTLVYGPRQRMWVDGALSHAKARRSFLIEGAPGVGKTALAMAVLETTYGTGRVARGRRARCRGSRVSSRPDDASADPASRTAHRPTRQTAAERDRESAQAHARRHAHCDVGSDHRAGGPGRCPRPFVARDDRWPPRTGAPADAPAGGHRRTGASCLRRRRVVVRRDDSGAACRAGTRRLARRCTRAQGSGARGDEWGATPRGAPADGARTCSHAPDRRSLCLSSFSMRSWRGFDCCERWNAPAAPLPPPRASCAFHARRSIERSSAWPSTFRERRAAKRNRSKAEAIAYTRSTEYTP